MQLQHHGIVGVVRAVRNGQVDVVDSLLI